MILNSLGRERKFNCAFSHRRVYLPADGCDVRDRYGKYMYDEYPCVDETASDSSARSACKAGSSETSSAIVDPLGDRQHTGLYTKASVLSWILRPISHCHTKMNRI